ncbi:cobalt-zinc-cadmium resistance protein CzcA [Chitinophaga terrae (ex Kim and Jung 2007)]|uniref:Cobalt-zinc-cadmium resistance protein CzcA n=1 Tax=Chitinophaga terrae (ex Kim and Jung 2007) TaxID=408074 RepID=A0A1H4G1H8_9BACT|nr:CusA/CzcA family heavy metal efflux RND transporter [Chitinophaga terrae (ex Kim and Jung 2007)]GEP93029.1 acriflavine resistance protein B [Chitinophaga terrae (ex Kim and Jung 2007)]SEB03449.1 cobalt-zinc-cadmium resistance protein CzcA [Chitinophaga terrae (ex Kim and Jung 2007)]
MLSTIIRFSIQHKLIIGLLTLALVGWGIWSARQLPIDAVPDITNNQVQIITNTPTLASQEVEQLVTYPIEQSLANLPDLIELRSISRFGLSVITIVFKEGVDIYFARQLIAEKLREAEEKIPPKVGKPEMAPVSTGLGEVYQYVIHPKKGSENKYTAMELRTMQDWIVARQLYGTPGIAEVNSFGGLVKQYEVAVKPDRLKALNVTLPEIFQALEKNNENTGGAYIDKKPNAYFIRGIGLVSSLEDIGNIVIKTADGIPVLIRNVATVQFGHAVRYGALTYNGEKEAVGGIVMMLKGANSAEVVGRIREKMETIKSSLPADVEIEPFLDRTGLVNRAINTVKRNLVEGALIVIFVLVLFLGNIRAGLIVASAIPLSMLFALGLMNLFGVSANLMSLGAIDFGLIVDGAVIIVEATMHHLGLRPSRRRLSQAEMDEEVFNAAARIRNSAAFGEIIILIVYIPILTLVGIEGKMFRPMAQTVGFAILGALILSLTYIPMMSALFLPKQHAEKETWSDKLMAWLQRHYEPVLKQAIKLKYWVIGVSVTLLAIAIILFSRMGGEFIPQLQEGDYAFHCILPQGSSLSQSIETSMQASRIIKSFPQVKMVVGKTGSAEVPTDPMPPEASDLVISLKPRKEWPVKESYESLASRMLEELEAIPGVFFEASQPIQMRFNELMTGVRQDVAIKIFGENIDTLATLAPKVAAIVQKVKGATAPQVERTVGLPQITVTYDRARMAGYGLNIQDINNTVAMAFAGKAASVVFENERKFDLVVRLDSTSRSTVDDVNNLYIALPDGTQIPLDQVAKVAIKEGPAQISREEGKRRIVVGFNVKGRDVASVVADIQKQLKAANLLPTGYYYTYGGTFENLQEASDRLRLAVPVCLLLIFLLLYFTFRSMNEALLIFTAIPMSAIGGVFALLLRGMPFSISAGVGFIALFGVAVLNGIVLISTFNQLKKDGVTDMVERIITGTKTRLRPVLMTAVVASFGFLPMALSTGAGAEVQKPLATVVIGGLITATLLTLIVLPLLYLLFGEGKKINIRPAGGLGIIAVLLLAPGTIQAQTRVSVDEAIGMGSSNLLLAANQQLINKGKAQVRTASLIPKTGVFAENEDYRPSDKTGILKIGLSQSIVWPGLYKSQRRLYEATLKGYQISGEVVAASLKTEIRSAYYQLWFLEEKQKLYNRLDSIYRTLDNAARLKVKTGDSPGLDSIAANVRSKEIRVLIRQLDNDMLIQQQELQRLLNTTEVLLPVNGPLEKMDFVAMGNDSLHPQLLNQKQQVEIANAGISVAKNENRPEFSGRFFNQRLYGKPDPYAGFSVTAAVPLFGMGAYRNRVKTAQAEAAYQASQYQYESQRFETQLQQALQEVQKNRNLLQFYESAGLMQAEEIIKASTLAYRAGQISFAELSQFLGQAIDIEKNYLDSLNAYNHAVINYNYFIHQ